MAKKAKRVKGTGNRKSTPKKAAAKRPESPQVAAANIIANTLDRVFLQRSVSQVSDNTFPDTVRNVDAECGYADPETMDATAWQKIYDRNEIAARVVELYPDECWQEVPTICETENPEEETVFEKAWKELPAKLRGETHFFSQEGSPIWEALEQLDILSGIGRYGILLLGLNDGAELREPVESQESNELLYLQPYSESEVKILHYETEDTNPRYGLPVMYQIEMRNLEMGSNVNNVKTGGTKKVEVHWTRVLHFFDPYGSSTVFGQTRMMQVYHRLYDLHKLHAGSSEMYWKGAFFGLSIETNPTLGLLGSFSDQASLQGKADSALADMKEQIQMWSAGLQRFLDLDGKTAKSLTPQVESPEKNAEVLKEAICIRLACPKRVFTGSERGELASGQDADAWKSRVSKRRVRVLTPRMIVPFVDRLISLGVLPKPGPDGFKALWGGNDSKNELETSQIAKNVTEALTKYILAGGDSLISPVPYLKLVLGLSDEQVKMVQEQLDEYNGDLEDPEE